MKRLIFGIVFLVIAVSACGDSVAPYPAPPVVSVPPTSSSIPDYTNASLLPVAGSTTTTAPSVGPGSANVTGTVRLNGTPIANASVHLDRFVGTSSGGLDVTTDSSGIYRANNVLGGRYRVRAYRAPDATTTTPQIFFLGDHDNKTLDLSLNTFGGQLFYSYAIAPNPPVLGQLANFAVLVTTEGVDGNGVARSTPVPGIAIHIATAGGRNLTTPADGTTDATGKVTFQLRCDSLQNQTLTLSYPDGHSETPNIAGCVAPAPTTTTTLVDPSASSTTTTATTAPKTTTTVKR